MDHSISERAQYLLKILIERYISEGAPIGSRTLADHSTLLLSPATIRNVLADLESRGYLTSPHTSSGRIPTQQGYRFFVNSLLTCQPMQLSMIKQFEQKLLSSADQTNLVEVASSLLTKMSHLASIVSTPRAEQILLRHIEFLPLSGSRMLVIIVVNEHEVQNRIITTDRVYTASECEQIGNFLTATFAGQELAKIRQELIKAMDEDRNKMDTLLASAIEVANKAIDLEETQDDFIFSGQENLLEMVEEAGVDQLRHLMDAFTGKQSILVLLDKCMQAEGVQIFIGGESGNSSLASCSFVTAPYKKEGQTVGVLGVVGPTRMPYQKVIPLVDLTAKILSSALT